MKKTAEINLNWVAPILECAQKSVFTRLVLCLAVAAALLLGRASGAVAAGTVDVRQYQKMTSDSLNALGKRYMNSGQLQRAMVCYTAVANRYTPDMSNRDKDLCADALNNCGVIYFNFSNFTRAYASFTKALEISNRRVIYSTYNNIACVYYIFHDMDNSRRYTEMAFNNSAKVKDWHLAMVSLQNLIETNLCSNTIDSLMPFVNRFCQLDIRPQDTEYRYLRSLCHATTLFSRKRYNDAAEAFRQSVPLADSIYQSDSRKTDTYRFVAIACEAMGDYPSAIDALKKAERTAHNHGFSSTEVDIFKRLSDCYEHTGNTLQALGYRKKYVDLKDSLLSNRDYGKIKDLQFFSEIDNYEKQVNELHLRNLYSERLLWVGGVLLCMILVSLLVTFHKNKLLRESYQELFRRNEDNMQRARMKRLLRQEKLKRQEIGKPGNCEADNAASDEPSGAAKGDCGTGEKDATEQCAKQKYTASALTDDAKRSLLDAVQHVMDCPENFCRPDFSLELLARLTESNPKYVSQVINELQGCNFSTMLNQCRINEACKLLTDTALSTSMTNEAIAERVGFKSRSHFNRIFKKMTGLTPTQYQKISKEERKCHN